MQQNFKLIFFSYYFSHHARLFLLTIRHNTGTTINGVVVF